MKQAFRLISRMKGYTALSLLGLIISLSGTIIISRYLYQEWTIDHWMPDLDRTYVLMEESSGDNPYPAMFYKSFLGRAELQSPLDGQNEIEYFSYASTYTTLQLKLDGEEMLKPLALKADSMFHRFFPLKAVAGTLVLRHEGDAIISEELAARLFPEGEAVGQTLTTDNGQLRTVIGVFRKPASKLSLNFDYVEYEAEYAYNNQGSVFYMVRLHPGASVKTYNKRQPVQTPNVFEMEGRTLRFQLAPYEGLLSQLWGERDVTVRSVSSPKYLWMLFAVAVLLFLVGIFNFLNLFAVMRSHRRHELEVRRIFGASRLDIFSMLYMENLLISALAMLGVWMVVELITPHMKDWFSIEQMSMPLFDTTLSLSIIFILPLIAIVGRLGKAGARSFLFLQYFISITLITVSLYLMRQLHFMMGSDPGYRTENILNCTPYPSRTWTGSGGPTMDWFETMKNDSKLLNDRLTACPHIKSFCSSGNIYKTGNELSVNNVSLEYQSISPQQMEMYGLEVVQGRAFNDTLDTREQYRCLLNETAIRQLGIKDIEKETVLPARRLWWIFDYTTGRMPDEQPLVPYEIVGVIRDYHPGKLSEPQPGMFFAYRKEEPDRLNGSEVAVEVMPGHEKEAIEYIQKTSREIFHVEELPYHWLKDDVASLYEEDRRTARIFFTFSFLAIAVTCLGVLGLMMFDVRRRYREIALRKVNGATFLDIALLLSRRYLIILAVAAAVSIPVSLIGLHQLITRYYTIHATIAWWIPLVSIAIVLLLCALTLWQQVWKATRIKPYEVLKEN
ncbi:MAG: ABC transporter permease [Bacteroidaceae bacterium]|nr:ABC transporter permease [Bacteroidaceae bacterium]